MQNVKEVSVIDIYLDEYLKKTFIEKGRHDLKRVCNNILNCKPVKGLDKYSKEILALAMEKRIVMSIEKNRQSLQNSSYWKHLKPSAPLIYQETDYLSDYMNLVVRDLYIDLTKHKSLEEINEFYNQEIYNATKLFSNKLFVLPNGKRVSVKDLALAINDAFNLNGIIKKEYVIKGKSGNLKSVVAIAGLTTIMASSIILSNQKEAEKLGGQTIIENLENSLETLKEIPKTDVKIENIKPIQKQFVGYENECPLEYQEYIYDMSKKYEVPFNAFMTIIDNESGGLFNTNGIISDWDDYGLCQINICNHDKIYKDLNITSSDLLNDPYKNIEAAAYLLQDICLMYPEEIKNGQYENIFGAYNGWKLWKTKETSVEYAADAMIKMNSVYNKTEEELFETKQEVSYGRK